LGLESESVHTAAEYMDRSYANTVPLPAIDGNAILDAVACLVIATKFSETQTDPEGYIWCPPLSDFLVAVRLTLHLPTPTFAVAHLNEAERRTLDRLEWNVRAASPYSFASAFRQLGFFCDTDRVENLPLLPAVKEQVWPLVREQKKR
jgi:hypothetical protein